MPRDLESERDTIQSLPPLSSQSRHSNAGVTSSSVSDDRDRIQKDMQSESERSKLNPYTELLTLQDVESCVLLENAAFPPNQRCSKEEFVYRFSQCGELCSGFFTTAEPGSQHLNAATAEKAPPVETGSNRKMTLLGHIIATKTTNRTILDEDMAVPPDWQEKAPSDYPKLGHKEHGRTVAVHSFAVLPNYQGKGIGKNLFNGYIKRIRDSRVADRVALLTEDKLVPYFEKFGFKKLGQSQATFGGEERYDMVLELGQPIESD